MSGTISGGWEYVWAAYGITAATLLIYTVTLFARYRSQKKRSDQHE